MSPPFTIRDATRSDLASLCELLAVLFQQEVEFHPDRGRQTAGLCAILDDANVGRVLVLEHEQTVVGMVSLLFLPSTALGGRVAILEDMVLRPEFRGRGAGGQLLDAAVATAAACGCLRITLLTDGNNSAGQRFYHRRGFVRSEMVPMRLAVGGER